MNKKVNSINELAPLWIDSVTRFDSLNLLANNTLLFHYQLIDIAKQDIDTANFINLIHPTMVDEVKENNNFKLFRAYKSIFTYRYKDVNGAVIKDVTVTPNQYQ